EGAGLRASEASLVYSPMLSADAQWVNDHKTNSLFPSAYRKFRNNSYTLGISQQTGIGLTGKLSYNLSSYHYVDSPSNGRLFWEGTPKIELSLSLLRNFFGSETRSQSELIEAAALAAQYQQSFHAKAIRANAESTYIQLANARQVKK